MALSEQARHQMYSRLEAVLGADEAATLMEHLPPVGWADVATKRDLAVLGTELRGEMRELRGEVLGEIGNLRGEIGNLRGELHSQLRTNLVASVTANAALVAVVAGVAGLF